MLILARRAGEAIRIGGDVRVVVIATGDGGVRLGIEAPGDVTILREELVLEVESENIRARAEPRSLADLIGGGDTAASESADPASPPPDDQSRGS